MEFPGKQFGIAGENLTFCGEFTSHIVGYSRSDEIKHPQRRA